MTAIEELMAKLDEVTRQIAAAKDADRREGIDKVKALMAESGVTVADLGGRAKAGPGDKRVSKVAAKYRDSNGNTWSGRGLYPRWLKASLAAGASLQDFAVA